MTLIITELSEFGIAMVADSAVTCKEELPSGRSTYRVLNGIRKLQLVSHLNAGISMWGLGSILTSDSTISTDVWITDFIERHQDTLTLDDFANSLVAELQATIGTVKEPMGIHLAGYVDVEGHPSQLKDSVKFVLIGKTQAVVSCGHEPIKQTPQPRSCATH